MKGILKDIHQIDICDINYRFSNPDMLNRFLSIDKSALPRKGIIIRALSFLWHTLRNFNLPSWITLMSFPEEKYLFFAKTKNQFDSLNPICNHMEDSVTLGYQGDYSDSLLVFWAKIISLPFFFNVLRTYTQAKGNIKEGFLYAFDEYWSIYGYFIIFNIFLKLKKPIMVIQSNDHNAINRVLNKVAKQRSIPTAYVQHGAVTHQFPPLEFDYAFLDGKDALDVYDKVGNSDCKIFLTGSPKFDMYYKNVNISKTVDVIGVCTNAFDSVERTRSLCQGILNNLVQTNIILRPHPTDRRHEEWKLLAKTLGISFSQSINESSYDYLLNVDVLIAGNSSIHLEAALLNVYPLYFANNPDKKLIANSFIRTGLCDYYASVSALIKGLIELRTNRPNIRNRSKYYCQTVGTNFDGKSSILITELLLEIIEYGGPILSKWEEIIQYDIEAYERI